MEFSSDGTLELLASRCTFLPINFHRTDESSLLTCHKCASQIPGRPRHARGELGQRRVGPLRHRLARPRPLLHDRRQGRHPESLPRNGE